MLEGRDDLTSQVLQFVGPCVGPMLSSAGPGPGGFRVAIFRKALRVEGTLKRKVATTRGFVGSRHNYLEVLPCTTRAPRHKTTCALNPSYLS